MKRFFFAIIIFSLSLSFAKDLKDIPYTQSLDEYAQQRCKLDIYKSKVKSDTLKPIFVWFHGGGISRGDKKNIPTGLIAHAKKGDFILVSANYRLSPKIKAWEAIEDCAEAVAWVINNSQTFGGDKKLVFIGGHSAGGYLSGMVGFAPKYLQKHNIENTDLAGLILLSGQVTKHFQVRKDTGDIDPQFLPKIDEFSILGNANNKIAPLCIIVGDRRLEWKCRTEENFLLEATVRTLKTSPYTEIFECQGLNHGTVASSLSPIASAFIKKISSKKK